MQEDKLWDRYFFPFQTSIQSISLPFECSELRILEKKYDDAISIYYEVTNKENESLFDYEDIVKISEYVKKCKTDLEDFQKKTKMSEKLVQVSLEIEKFNKKNDKIKEIITKKIHPLNELNNYFFYKQEKQYNNLIIQFKEAEKENVDFIQSCTQVYEN